MWARCPDTSRASLRNPTRYTIVDECEKMMHGSLHGHNDLGFGPSESWCCLYTSSTLSPDLKTGYFASLLFSVACFSASSVNFNERVQMLVVDFPVFVH